MIGGPEIRLSK